jgi:hypothetical protein
MPSEITGYRARSLSAIPNQRERKQTMIHTMITAIGTNLPMLHILSGAITGLLIAASTFLWLKRGSRSGAIVLLALLAIERVPGGLAAPRAVHAAGRAAGCFPSDSTYLPDGPLQATDIAV